MFWNIIGTSPPIDLHSPVTRPQEPGHYLCQIINHMKNIQTAQRPANESVATIGSVTRQMVHERTLELALTAGRNSHQIRQADYEQAKRELTGESDFDRQQQILDFLEY